MTEDSWARSTKTRIETNMLAWLPRKQKIREQDPLKQGLKHSVPAYQAAVVDSWARSTKTRIETIEGDVIEVGSEHSWARSTKTRIETDVFLCFIECWKLPGIREQDPLKQGLKPRSRHTPKILGRIREQDPLKQGLKRKTEKEDMIIIILFVSKIH